MKPITICFLNLRLWPQLKQLDLHKIVTHDISNDHEQWHVIITHESWWWWSVVRSPCLHVTMFVMIDAGDMFDVMMMRWYLYLAWHLMMSVTEAVTHDGCLVISWLRVWSHWLIRQKIMYSRQHTQIWTPDAVSRDETEAVIFTRLSQFISMAESPWDCDDTSPLRPRTRAVGCNVYNTMISLKLYDHKSNGQFLCPSAVSMIGRHNKSQI